MPGSWLPAWCPRVPVALGTPDLPLSLSPGCLCVVSLVVFLSLFYLPSFSPKPCPCPSVGLNKQSLNTPVCAGAVAAEGGPWSPLSHCVPCRVTGPGARGCLGGEEEEGTALVPKASAHPRAGKCSGCPLWGFWRARTAPVPHCRHSCRDLSLSCGRTGGTRVSRSSKQLEPMKVGPAQLPALFPSPHGDKLGPHRGETPGLSLHRGGTAPILPSAPAHSSTTARAVEMRVQPSPPCSHPFRHPLLYLSLPCAHPFPSPCPAGRQTLCLSQIPDATGRWLSFSCLFSRPRSEDRLFLNVRGNY